MKLLLSFIASALVITAHAQLSSGDSLLVEKLWRKAAQTELHAPVRQRYLDSALALDPTNAYFWQQKAMPLFKAQKCEAGMPYLDSAVKYNVQRYLPYRAFMKCMFQRNYRDAITDLNAAKQMDSAVYVMDHPFDFFLSICYLQLNDLDAAERYSRKCISDRRKKFGNQLDHYIHFFYDGIIQMEKENYEEAIKSFNVAMDIYPKFSDGKYYLAYCYHHLNDRDKALSLYKQSLENLKQGYTIAEDNVIHERYPYQIKDRWLQSVIESMEKKEQK